MPTRYRADLEKLAHNELNVTLSPDGCLVIFPRPKWQEFKARLVSMPSEGQWFKRTYLGNVADVSMDKAGRVLISPELREEAGIGREATLLGLETHFELWDKAALKAKRSEAFDPSKPQPKCVQEFVI